MMKNSYFINIQFKTILFLLIFFCINSLPHVVFSSEYYNSDEISDYSIPDAKPGNDTFYVDSINGQDGMICNGLYPTNEGSPNCPFKTIQFAVQTLSPRTNDIIPGDVVKIRAGIYKETMSLRVAGNEQNWITIGPYGDGEVIVDPSYNLEWKLHSDSVYQSEWPNVDPVRVVIINDTALIPVASISDLSEGKFFYDSEAKNIYIYSNQRLPLDKHDISVIEDDRTDNSKSALFVNSAHYNKITGLTFRRAAAKGISIKANNVIIENCKATQNVNSGISIWPYGTILAENVILRKNLISDNYLHNWPRGRDFYTNGLWGKGIDSIGTTFPIISYNIVNNNGGEGIGVCRGTNGTISKNIVFDNWSVGVYLNQQNGVSIYSNLIYATEPSATDLSADLIYKSSDYNKSRRRLRQIGVSTGDEDAVATQHIDIANNIIINCSVGITHIADELGSGLKNVKVANNTIIMPTKDVWEPSGPDATPGASHAFGISYSENNGNNINSFVKNNIIIARHSNTPVIRWMWYSSETDNGLQFDNNLYYSTNSGDHFYYKGSRYSFSDYKEISNNDLNSKFEDPKFKGLIGSFVSAGYSLEETSPARDGGVFLNEIPEDFNMNYRLTPYDIGAIDSDAKSDCPIILKISKQ